MELQVKTLKYIFSFLFRKTKTYCINVLDFIAYSEYYYYFSVVIAVTTIFFKGAIAHTIWNVIAFTWLISWLYILHATISKQEDTIKQLEDDLEATKQVLDYDILVDNLAPIMHDIWSKDVYQLDQPTQQELDRAGTTYYNLSESDKEHNRAKARLIIDWFDEQ